MEYIRTLLAPEPGLYSQGVLVNNFLFLSGQTGNIPMVKGEPVIDDTVYNQTLRALENLMAVVIAAGGQADSIVRLGIFLKDSGTREDRIQSAKDLNAAYKKFFETHRVPKEKLPARTMVFVAEVPLPYPLENTLVEIEGVAFIPK